jgi:hypothetical protein
LPDPRVIPYKPQPPRDKNIILAPKNHRETKHAIQPIDPDRNKVSKVQDCLPPNIRARADFKKLLNTDLLHPRRLEIYQYDDNKVNTLCMLLEQETPIMSLQDIFYPSLEYHSMFTAEQPEEPPHDYKPTSKGEDYTQEDRKQVSQHNVNDCDSYKKFYDGDSEVSKGALGGELSFDREGYRFDDRDLTGGGGVRFDGFYGVDDGVGEGVGKGFVGGGGRGSKKDAKKMQLLDAFSSFIENL